MQNKVDILLSTFNGSKYLQEQLDSIAQQSLADWKLIVRDDGSSDDTVAILEKFCRLHPNNVLMIRDGLRLGAKMSFGELMKHSSAPYIAFCDQDDIWDECKLDTMLNALQNQEKKHRHSIPVLVHSDLEVVNEHLEPINSSFWAYQGLAPSRNKIPQLLADNTVTGCATLFNKALLKLASPIPDAAYMHDYWLALVAALTGKIVVIKKPLVKYRQHGSNTLGAIQGAKLLSLPRGPLSPSRWRIDFSVAIRQANALLMLANEKKNRGSLHALRDIINLYDKNGLLRRFILLRHDILPARLRKKLTFLARI